MARPRKTDTASPSPSSGIGGLADWARMLGEALGRGVAQGINAGLGSANSGSAGSSSYASAPLQVGVRRRGRPPRAKTSGPVPPERRCKVDGCPNEARSKGLCSKHYQAERRRLLAKGKSA
ncbi:MAG TPA: hypothetical protein VFA20_18790 [Myxococcaceae bacterium]|nr:hypothetical protein [Myxococcaceae bacterium]